MCLYLVIFRCRFIVMLWWCNDLSLVGLLLNAIVMGINEACLCGGVCGLLSRCKVNIRECVSTVSESIVKRSCLSAYEVFVLDP